jgi:hypothetical protein
LWKPSLKWQIFLETFLTEAELGSLMGALETGSDEKAAVEEWLSQHQELEGRLRSFVKSTL